MKKLLTFLLLLLSFVSFSQTFKYERANIEITFDTAFSLPESWKIVKSPVVDNKQHYIDVIKASLDKYSVGILKNLKKIYLLHTFTSKGVSIGGTMYDGNIYIKLRGITDSNIEKTIHHEFCHILFGKYKTLFPTLKWMENTKLEYSGTGFKNLQNGKGSKEYNVNFYTLGCLYEYGASSMDEDMASFAELMFYQYSNKDIIRNNPLLKNKYELLTSFYKKIDVNISIASL